jgi:hypothetical protein
VKDAAWNTRRLRRCNPSTPDVPHGVSVLAAEHPGDDDAKLSLELGRSLPEVTEQSVKLRQRVEGQSLGSPLFVSSMRIVPLTKSTLRH